MFESYLASVIRRVGRTRVSAGSADDERALSFLLGDPITHPEGDEVFARLTRETVYPAELHLGV